MIYAVETTSMHSSTEHSAKDDLKQSATEKRATPSQGHPYVKFLIDQKENIPHPKSTSHTLILETHLKQQPKLGPWEESKERETAISPKCVPARHWTYWERERYPKRINLYEDQLPRPLVSPRLPLSKKTQLNLNRLSTKQTKKFEPRTFALKKKINEDVHEKEQPAPSADAWIQNEKPDISLTQPREDVLKLSQVEQTELELHDGSFVEAFGQETIVPPQEASIVPKQNGVSQAPTPINLSHKPTNIICPFCHAACITKVVHVNSPKTHLVAVLLCTTLLLCFVPYLMDKFKKSKHYCSSCGVYIGSMQPRMI